MIHGFKGRCPAFRRSRSDKKYRSRISEKSLWVNADVLKLPSMKLSSPAFANDAKIPQKYGRDFENINPPLEITNVPVGTVSLVLMMEDPDVPAGAPVAVWDHWVVFDIGPEITTIPENWTPTGTRGKGTRGELDYGGPRPPDREHRYFFKVYALDTKLDLPEGSSKQQVIEAMGGHVLDQAELMGRYAP